MPKPEPAQFSKSSDGRVEGNSARRQEVIDVAAGLFAKHGFHGIGTRRLADQLGIKVASLYFFVKSKDHALEEICHRGIDSAIYFAHSALTLQENFADRLRHYFKLMHKQLREEADYINVFVHERRHLEAEGGARIEEKLRTFRRHLTALFEQAQANEEIYAGLSPRTASFLMIGTIRNLMQLYTEGPLKDFDQFMDDAVEALIRAVSRPN